MADSDTILTYPALKRLGNHAGLRESDVVALIAGGKVG